MVNDNTALVLGATGGIGGEVARQLRDSGWTVRALRRGAAQSTEQRDGMTWIRGDVMNAEEVRTAAQGCSVIVHAVNPPGYRRWAELVLPMLDNTIAAARVVGVIQARSLRLVASAARKLATSFSIATLLAGGK